MKLRTGQPALVCELGALEADYAKWRQDVATRLPCGMRQGEFMKLTRLRANIVMALQALMIETGE